MRRWKNDLGDWVSDVHRYYVCVSNSEDDFFTEGDPKSFGGDIVSARIYAQEQSLLNKAAEVRCESWIPDPAYSAPVTLWSERYEKGKKLYRQNWR